MFPIRASLKKSGSTLPDLFSSTLHAAVVCDLRCASQHQSKLRHYRMQRDATILAPAPVPDPALVGTTAPHAMRPAYLLPSHAVASSFRRTAPCAKLSQERSQATTTNKLRISSALPQQSAPVPDPAWAEPVAPQTVRPAGLVPLAAALAV